MSAQRADALAPKETIGDPAPTPVIRYRLITTHSGNGEVTTDLTVEVTGEGVTLADFMALQKAAQAEVDATYPPTVIQRMPIEKWTSTGG